MSLSRGEVVWVRLSVGEGTEQSKTRPAIVVSNNAANRSAIRNGRGVVTIAPLTSARTIALPHQVAAPMAHTGLTRDAVVQTEQIRAVDIQRVMPTGRLAHSELMASLGHSLRVHLGI